jgi:ribonucleoside-diphosphate reductase alpha chain
MQSGRAGACTSYYNIFDVEASAIAQLQDPRAPEDKRNRKIHFAVSYHGLFMKKAALNENVFTFSCKTAPDLFDAFYGKDRALFESLYNRYEQDPTFKKNYVNARDLLVMTEQQGPNIGTHYDFFADNANAHTPFLEPIYSSNLCLEIMEVTHPYKDSDQLHKAEYHGIIKFLDGNGQEQTIAQNTLCWFIKDGQADLSTEFPAGELEEGAYVKTIFGEYFVEKILVRDQQPEVALCSLAGIVEPNIRDDAHYEHAMYYAQRMIDYCIHNSSYPFAHIAFTAKKRLNAGIGLLGAATTMARKKLHYDTQEGLNQIHRMAERHMYFAIRSSIRLGKERGNAPWIHKTLWPKGWLPIDTYKREVDEICNEPLHYDWEAERRALIENKGMRFSCLVAHMPTESSSKAAGVPNSWYPVRMISMAKSDAFNIIDWTATDSDLLGSDYQLAFTIKPKDMIKVYAVIQKFTDQGISADIYMDRSRTLDISATDLVEHVLLMQRLGLKSRYYVNSKTDDAESAKAEACGSGGCTL